MTPIRAWLRRYRLLLTFGVCTELIYLLYSLRRFPLVRYYRVDTDMGFITGHSPDHLAVFALTLTGLFALFALASYAVRQASGSDALLPVLGFGATFAATMAFVYPITAIDLFTYVAQSRILVHYGQNPIFVAPALYPRDPATGLTGGWMGFGSPYGPLGILVDALPTALAGNDLLVNLLLLKLMFSSMVLGCALLVYCLLRGCGSSHPVEGAILVCWNPLILIEVSANGHNDAAMMILALAGLLLLQQNRLMLGTVTLVISALVKYATGLLFPLALVYGLRHQQDRPAKAGYVLLTCGYASLVVAALYLPFWRGIETIDRGLQENGFYVASFSSVLTDLLSPHLSLDQASLIGRLLFAPVYAYVLVRATQRFPELLHGSFLALFAFLALAVNDFKGWYAVWLVMLAACAPTDGVRPAALLLGWAVSLSPALFMYGGPLLAPHVVDPTALINGAVYLLDFLPAAVVLVTGALRSSTARSASDLHPEPGSLIPASEQD